MKLRSVPICGMFETADGEKFMRISEGDAIGFLGSGNTPCVNMITGIVVGLSDTKPVKIES